MDQRKSAPPGAAPAAAHLGKRTLRGPAGRPCVRRLHDRGYVTLPRHRVLAEEAFYTVLDVGGFDAFLSGDIALPGVRPQGAQVMGNRVNQAAGGQLGQPAA